MKLTSISALIAALALSGAACIAEEDIATDEGANEEFIALASVERDNGNVVEFYETAPGSIVVSESGPIGNEFSFTEQELHDSAPMELYREIAGEQEPPAALVEASERRRALIESGLVEEPGIGTQEQALSNGIQYKSCADARLFASGGPGYGGNVGTRAKSGSDLMYDKHFYRFTLCVYPGQSGSVSMEGYTRRWWSWKKYLYRVTYPGQFRWWSHTDWTWDFDAKTRFWNGNGIMIDTLMNCSPYGYNCWN